MDSEDVLEGAGGPTFDPAEAMSVVADDKELLSQMVALFCAESPRMLSAIRKSVEDGDGKALARTAHALKGSVGNFGKSESFRLAAVLEKNGTAGAMTETKAQLVSLEGMIARLERDLVNFCG
jgi:two-component system, sensor histidine kinase and response regulator